MDASRDPDTEWKGIGKDPIPDSETRLRNDEGFPAVSRSSDLTKRGIKGTFVQQNPLQRWLHDWNGPWVPLVRDEEMPLVQSSTQVRNSGESRAPTSTVPCSILVGKSSASSKGDNTQCSLLLDSNTHSAGHTSATSVSDLRSLNCSHADGMDKTSRAKDSSTNDSGPVLEASTDVEIPILSGPPLDAYLTTLSSLLFSRSESDYSQLLLAGGSDSRPCPLCERTFDGADSKSYLMRHIRAKHLNQPKVVCPHCNRSFTTKYNMTRHLLSIASKKDGLHQYVTPQEPAKKDDQYAAVATFVTKTPFEDQIHKGITEFDEISVGDHESSKASKSSLQSYPSDVSNDSDYDSDEAYDAPLDNRLMLNDFHPRHLLIERIMQGFYATFNSEWKTKSKACTESHSATHGGTASFPICQDGATNTSHKRNKPDRDASPPRDGDRDRKRKNPSVDRDKCEGRPRFACPFHKFNPQKYCVNDQTGQDYRTCWRPGFESISRLK